MGRHYLHNNIEQILGNSEHCLKLFVVHGGRGASIIPAAASYSSNKSRINSSSIFKRNIISNGVQIIERCKNDGFITAHKLQCTSKLVRTLLMLLRLHEEQNTAKSSKQTVTVMPNRNHETAKSFEMSRIRLDSYARE